MNPTIKPIGEPYSTVMNSDISELSIGRGGLRILLITGPADKNVNSIVEITFPYCAGMRLLDEGDIFGCWNCKDFSTGHHVYEIISGGWKDQELNTPGMLVISGEAIPHREFFIVTSNNCVNALSQDPPTIRTLKEIS